MYFPVSELHGWGKRFAAQPQTIYSEVPSLRGESIVSGTQSVSDAARFTSGADMERKEAAGTLHAGRYCPIFCYFPHFFTHIL